MNVWRFVLLAVAAALLAGCQLASVPATGIVRGTDFDHRWIGGDSLGTAGILHLYVDGDGRPFLDRRTVAADPTPQTSQVLRWMRQDPAPAIYLGRPCYLGMARLNACDSRWWTTDRYAPAVVDSMVAAARRLLAGRPVVLIGYSGGGTLAIAMAARLDNVRGLVTVAANVNVTAWTALHGYSPLTSPGNLQAALRQLRHLPQVHYVGGRDANVPPAIAVAVLGAGGSGRVCLFERWDHDCCWAQRWPRLLDALAAGGTGGAACKSVDAVDAPRVYSLPMDESGDLP